MTKRDAHGLEISAEDDASLAAIDAFGNELLAMGTNADRILEAAETHPECSLVQTYAALFLLYGTTKASREAALPLVEQAEKTAGLPREKAWVEATKSWVLGDYEATMDRCEAITQQWPRDLVAAKVAEFHYYLTGQYWQASRFLTHMERINEANANAPHFLSMHAFALELSGRTQQSHALAERAIAAEPHNPWAHHAIAHLYTRRANPDKGVAVVKGYADTWQSAGTSIRSHNFWHLAVLYLDRLEVDEALALHQGQVFERDQSLAGIQLDAISLLWRIEMAGRRQETLWDRVADATSALAGDFPMPYAAAHHAFLFARTGREDALRNTLDAAERATHTPLPGRRAVWTKGGLDLVRGCAAFGTGDAKRAAHYLAPQIERVGASGGSDAQIDLFHQTHFRSLLESGQSAGASSWLERRSAGRRKTALEEHWASQL